MGPRTATPMAPMCNGAGVPLSGYVGRGAGVSGVVLLLLLLTLSLPLAGGCVGGCDAIVALGLWCVCVCECLICELTFFV